VAVASAGVSDLAPAFALAVTATAVAGAGRRLARRVLGAPGMVGGQQRRLCTSSVSRCATLGDPVVGQHQKDEDARRCTCNLCGEEFASRSKLFAHLGGDSPCAVAALLADETEGGSAGSRDVAKASAKRKGPKLAAAFLVGYPGRGPGGAGLGDGSGDSGCGSAAAEQLVADAVSWAAHGGPGGQSDERLAITRASGDRARCAQVRDSGHGTCILRQEESCGADGDVVAARFASSLSQGEFLARVAAFAAAEHEDAERRRRSGIDAGGRGGARILDVALLTTGEHFCAEALCTQRVYDYLLPVRALDPELGGMPLDVQDGPISLSRTQPWYDERLKSTFTKFKAALKALVQAAPEVRSEVEVGSGSEQGSGREEERAPQRSGAREGQEERAAAQRAQHFAGRKLYGSQGRPIYSWHNFAPPELEGNLDPQKAAVRGALDRFWVTGGMVLQGELFLLVRMTGDRFLTQQCRRLVAVAVCAHRGWLPADFLASAFRQDVILSTPLAPAHLLLLRECHFGVWSRRNGQLFDRSWAGRMRAHGGRPLEFESYEAHGGRPQQAQKEWSEALWSIVRDAEFGPGLAVERRRGQGAAVSWLRDLETRQAPEIRAELQDLAETDAAMAAGRFLACCGTWRAAAGGRAPRHRGRG